MYIPLNVKEFFKYLMGVVGELRVVEDTVVLYITV